MSRNNNSRRSTLLAGVGRCDITPAPGTPQGGWGAQVHERGTGADMPLFATALALERDEERVLVIDVDSIGFDAEWTSRIVKAIAALTGVERGRIRLSCTHTHSGPNTFRLKNILEGMNMALSYLDSLPHRIAGAAWQAWNHLEPVRVGIAVGECKINRNRRVATPQGEVVVGVNEDAPTDSTLHVLRLDREDGSVLAAVIHYACHGTTVGWQSQSFTPDFPGVARRTVEEQLGGHCLFLQGAAGDLGPRRGFTGDLSVYRQLGLELGLASASLVSGIDTRPQSARLVSVMPSGANIAQYVFDPLDEPDPKLRNISRMIRLPLKVFPPTEILEREYDELGSQVRHLKEIGDEFGFRRMQARATQSGWRLENARRYGGRHETDWPMQAIRIGPVVLVSVAGEPFSSIGRRVREASPSACTLFSGYSNGGFGYIPDREAYEEGGYEVEATPFSADAGDIVVEQALKMIREI